MENILRRQKEDEDRRLAGERLRQETLAKAREHLADLQSKLQSFARTEMKRIHQDPAFRDEFNNMCATIGVDPLQSRNGIFSQLGFGNFYHELAIKTIDQCLRLKK
jgi:ESCRT-II complex subunit VPS22